MLQSNSYQHLKFSGKGRFFLNILYMCTFSSVGMPRPGAHLLYAHMVEVLKHVSEGMSITEASQTYDIPYKTLYKHARKTTGN